MKPITFTQYVHPNGTPRQVSIEVPDEVAKMAEGQVLSCECMPHDFDRVVVYSHPKGADPEEDPDVEEVMFADNGPGENSPAAVMERLIRLVDKQNISQGGNHEG